MTPYMPAPLQITSSVIQNTEKDILCWHLTVWWEKVCASNLFLYLFRIAGGQFSIDDVTYILAQNDGNNHLHGGIIVGKLLWYPKQMCVNKHQSTLNIFIQFNPYNSDYIVWLMGYFKNCNQNIKRLLNFKSPRNLFLWLLKSHCFSYVWDL